jgi:Tfp pilus assembly protein PilE
MSETRLSQAGFTVLELVTVLVSIVILGLIAYYVFF